MAGTILTGKNRKLETWLGFYKGKIKLDYSFQTQFNIQQFYVLPTQCICVFCVDLRTNSDYFPIQH